MTVSYREAVARIIDPFAWNTTEGSHHWWERENLRYRAFKIADRIIALSDSDGSPKGGDGEAGSVHDGAGRETASPHTSPPSSPQAG